MPVVIQIIGAIAVIFWILSVQMKQKKNIIFFQLIANAFYSAQYFILQAPSAAFMNLISVARFLVLYQYDKDKKIKNKPTIILFFFILLIVLVGIFYVKTPLDIIPLGITLAYTLSTWQNNRKVLIWTFIIAACIWIFYNISVGAYSSLIGNAFEIISGAIALMRIKNSKK